MLMAMVLVAAGLILRFGRVPRSAFELTGAALLIGVAGYIWQGQPGAVGQPIDPAANPSQFNPDLAALRRQLNGENFGFDSQYLDYADTALRFGSPIVAVRTLQRGLRENPNSPALWTGLGTALVAHGEGQVSPAAVFAFERAMRLGPGYPGPHFFYGLALAEGGRLEDARTQWQAVLAKAPANAPWRPAVESNLQRLDAAIARGPR